MESKTVFWFLVVCYQQLWSNAARIRSLPRAKPLSNVDLLVPILAAKDENLGLASFAYPPGNRYYKHQPPYKTIKAFGDLEKSERAKHPSNKRFKGEVVRDNDGELNDLVNKIFGEDLKLGSISKLFSYDKPQLEEVRLLAPALTTDYTDFDDTSRGANVDDDLSLKYTDLLHAFDNVYDLNTPKKTQPKVEKNTNRDFLERYVHKYLDENYNGQFISKNKNQLVDSVEKTSNYRSLSNALTGVYDLYNNKHQDNRDSTEDEALLRIYNNILDIAGNLYDKSDNSDKFTVYKSGFVQKKAENDTVATPKEHVHSENCIHCLVEKLLTAVLPEDSAGDDADTFVCDTTSSNAAKGVANEVAILKLFDSK